MLLEELRLFDNQVYGVAHGLLMGYREKVWFQAQSLFDEVRQMDSSTASAFYNALTDMLWHFGQVGDGCFTQLTINLLENIIILGTLCSNQCLCCSVLERLKASFLLLHELKDS